MVSGSSECERPLRWWEVSTGCVSLTTRGSGGTAHTCCGRHSQYSCVRTCIAPCVRHCLVHRCPGSTSDPL